MTETNRARLTAAYKETALALADFEKIGDAVTLRQVADIARRLQAVTAKLECVKSEMALEMEKRKV